jgi:hypothetical protein
MIRHSQKQTGSVHIVIVIILILLIICGLSYFAWNKLLKTSGSAKSNDQPVSQVETQKSKSENKYVNYENNFEFLFPKKTFAPDKCEAYNTKPDGYGNMVPSEVHYGASDGAVPMTILEKPGEYLIVPIRTVVQLSPKGSNEEGYIYTSCEVQPVTLDLINNLGKDNYGMMNAVVDQRSFTVRDADSKSEANNVAEVIFNDPKGTAVWTQDSNEEDRLVGGFKYDTTADRTGGFAYKLWYYPAQKKVVYFALGQSVFFQYPDGSNQYYNPVDSFKFT